MRGKRPRGTSLAVAAALLVTGCGDDEDERIASAPPTAAETATEVPTPTEPTVSVASEGLKPSETEAVVAAAQAYLEALNRGDGRAVCALLEPRAIRLEELPVTRGSCASSMTASIGHRRRGGTPAWRRTRIAELKATSVGEDRARVTATVTHDFADRAYNSIEEDVIYLDRAGGRWLIAKPSGTFYRAIGYPEPPLRALTPPSG